MIDFIITIDDCAVNWIVVNLGKFATPYQPFYFLSSFVS
ncbi:Uncharacterised protein [Streptococcus pyogenes]|nr:Uncharacterised protein [Streptococcus pyogenes]